MASPAKQQPSSDLERPGLDGPPPYRQPRPDSDAEHSGSHALAKRNRKRSKQPVDDNRPDGTEGGVVRRRRKKKRADRSEDSAFSRPPAGSYGPSSVPLSPGNSPAHNLHRTFSGPLSSEDSEAPNVHQTPWPSGPLFTEDSEVLAASPLPQPTFSAEEPQVPHREGWKQTDTGDLLKTTVTQEGIKREDEVTPAPRELDAEEGNVIEDKITAIFCGNGTYQRLSLGFSMMAYFALAVQLFVDKIIVRDVRFACRGMVENASQPFPWPPPEDSCRQRFSSNVTLQDVPCTAWVYENYTYENTIVQEWDMVCWRQWLRPLTRVSFIAGGLVSWMLPFVMDRTGRQPLILASVFAAIVFSFAANYTTSVVTFMLSRCALGVCLAAIYIPSFVLMFETVAAEYRALYAVAAQLGFSFGQLYVAMLKSHRLSWRILHVSCTLPVCALTVAYLALSESPRWLVARGDLKRAEAVALRAARLNGVSRQRALVYWQQAQQDVEKSHERWSAILQASYQGMSSSHCRYVLVMFVSRFSCSLAYLSVASHYVATGAHQVMGGNALTTLDIASVVLGYTFMERYGRRSCVAACFFTSGLTWLLIIFISDDAAIEYAVLVVLGLLATGVAYAVLPVQNVELFPQLVRTYGYCWGEASAILGALGSPYISWLADATRHWFPFMAFSLLAVISGFLVLCLPETRLQDTRPHKAPSVFEFPAASRNKHSSSEVQSGEPS